MTHPQKPQYRHKKFAKISYTSRVIANFVLNFVAMTTGVDRGKMRFAAFDVHPRKPPIGAKNIAKISYTSRVIAIFVPNFVAMATGVGRGKMRLAAFDGPSPKTPYRRKKYRKNFVHKPSYSQFCPKFRCHGNQGGSGVKLNDTIRLAISENHTLEPKITTLYYTQPKVRPRRLSYHA